MPSYIINVRHMIYSGNACGAGAHCTITVDFRQGYDALVGHLHIADEDQK